MAYTVLNEYGFCRIKKHTSVSKIADSSFKLLVSVYNSPVLILITFRHCWTYSFPIVPFSSIKILNAAVMTTTFQIDPINQTA